MSDSEVGSSAVPQHLLFFGMWEIGGLDWSGFSKGGPLENACSSAPWRCSLTLLPGPGAMSEPGLRGHVRNQNRTQIGLGITLHYYHTARIGSLITPKSGASEQQQPQQPWPRAGAGASGGKASGAGGLSDTEDTDAERVWAKFRTLSGRPRPGTEAQGPRVQSDLCRIHGAALLCFASSALLGAQCCVRTGQDSVEMNALPPQMKPPALIFLSPAQPHRACHLVGHGQGLLPATKRAGSQPVESPGTATLLQRKAQQTSVPWGRACF